MAKTLKQIRAGRLVYAVVYTTPQPSDRGRQRAQKQQASTAARERLNARTSYQKLERTLAANFDTGDLFITLTYDDAHLPPNRDAAIRRIRSFNTKLRRARKERGQPLLYVYVTEEQTSAGRRLHHHMVVNSTGADLDEIRRLWIYGDSVEIRRLTFDHLQTYEDLAGYLTKEPREYGHPEVGERTWTPSLGLKQPEPETEQVPDYVTLTPPPEAIVLANEGPIRNGYGEYAWIKYLLPKRPADRRPKAKRRRRGKE